MLERAERLGYAAVEPIVGAAERAGVTPNTVTVFSVVVACVAGFFLYIGTTAGYAAAVCLVLVNGIFDVVDGELARRTGTASAKGDLLDHAADRYADVAVVTGAAAGVDAWFFGTLAASGVLFDADAGTAAQAAGVGRLYRGLLTRADISALVVVGGGASAAGVEALGVEPFVVVLGALTVGGHLTTFQRLFSVRRLAGNNS